MYFAISVQYKISTIWIFRIRRIESKKHADFSRESGKLAIQIKNDYYINRENARIEEILNNFS